MKGKRKPRARYGSGSLYQRGLIWHVKYREVRRSPDGTASYVQHRVSTHSQDRMFAEKFLRRKLLEIGGRRVTVVDPEKVSYEDLRENFLVHCAGVKLRSLKHAKDGTITLATLPRLDKTFTTWRAADIKVSHLRRFRAECLEDGLSDARANRYMATLRAMFNQGRKDELLTRTEIPAYFPMAKESKKARGAIFCKPEWYAPLLKALEEPLRSAFALAYHVGIRVHEMMRLRWRDFDFKKPARVRLPGEITKTGDPRTVPLPSDFDRKAGPPDDLVFPLGDCRERWREACIKVGAGYYECRECGARCLGRECPTHGKRQFKGLRYRGLLLRHTRHTAVRNMIEAGIPRKRAKDVSGHITDSTFDRYDIDQEQDVAKAGDAIEIFHRKQQRKLRPKG